MFPVVCFTSPLLSPILWHFVPLWDIIVFFKPPPSHTVTFCPAVSFCLLWHTSTWAPIRGSAAKFCCCAHPAVTRVRSGQARRWMTDFCTRLEGDIARKQNFAKVKKGCKVHQDKMLHKDKMPLWDKMSQLWGKWYLKYIRTKCNQGENVLCWAWQGN
jgi:hypothetical protein